LVTWRRSHSTYDAITWVDNQACSLGKGGIYTRLWSYKSMNEVVDQKPRHLSSFDSLSSLTKPMSCQCGYILKLFESVLPHQNVKRQETLQWL